MTMVSSGPISLGGNATTGGLNQSINIELGQSATATISLNDSNVRTLLGVPSGAISLNNAYGKSNSFAFTISSNQTNANLRTLAVNAGWNQNSRVIATVGSGVFISSTSTSTPALTVNGSFPGGVELINSGSIIGKGGNGANGGGFIPPPPLSKFSPYLFSKPTVPNPGSGGGGGNALTTSVALSVTNNGTIAGGGGGGGGGGYGFILQGKGDSGFVAGGSGGGGGQSYQATTGGTGGSGAQNWDTKGGNGAGGSNAGAGAGSSKQSYAYPYNPYTGFRGGVGGNGASYGASGTSGGGGTAGSGGGAGGAGGSSVSGNSNITWIATGTRLGAIT